MIAAVLLLTGWSHRCWSHETLISTPGIVAAAVGSPPSADPRPSSPGEDSDPQSTAQRLVVHLRSLGAWAPIGFIGLFVAACILCVPVVLFTMAGGALFGWFWGFVYAWLAAQLGASASFFISRRLAHDWVARRLARRPVLAAIQDVVADEGWKVVGLLRLAPGSPFFVLNYLFGLTRVRYRDYAWATAISIIPGTLLFTYLGSLGELALSGRLRTPWDWLLHGVGLVALGAACLLIGRRAHQNLRARLRQPEPRP